MVFRFEDSPEAAALYDQRDWQDSFGEDRHRQSERDIPVPVRSPSLVVVASRTAPVAALIALPGFASLAEQKPNNAERSQRVYPPGADQQLRDEPDDDDEGQPTAGNALDCIGPKGAAAESFCESQLRRERTYMTGKAPTQTIKPARENSAPCRVHSFQPALVTT